MASVQDLILDELRYIREKVDSLPCQRHETKIEELNGIRKLVMSTLVRWAIPVLLSGALFGYLLFSYAH